MLSVDHVGQVPFEGTDGLHRRLALSQAAAVVGAAGRVVAELDDGHDVQDPVDAPVAGPGQAVALLVTGGGFDRGGAVPGGEVRRGAEPVDVADVAEQAGRAGRADPVEFAQRAAGLGDELVQLLVRGPDLASMTVSSSMSSRASWWRVWATMPTGSGAVAAGSWPGPG